MPLDLQPVSRLDLQPVEEDAQLKGYPRLDALPPAVDKFDPEADNPLRIVGKGLATEGKMLLGGLSDALKLSTGITLHDVAQRGIMEQQQRAREAEFEKLKAQHPEAAGLTLRKSVPEKLRSDLVASVSDEPLPIQETTKTLPTAVRIPVSAGQGLIETAPKLAGVAGLQAAGVPAPLAAGAVFGTTEQGFDPKQAVIAAALPFLGKYSGEVAGTIAKKFGVDNTTAINWIKGVSGTAGPAAALVAEQEVEISKLPKEQQREARINMWANVAGQVALGPMGVEFEKSKPAVEAKGAPDAVQQKSQQVLPSVQPRVQPKPSEVPAEASGGAAGVGGSEVKPAASTPDVPKKIADDLGFRYDSTLMGRWNFTAYDSEGKPTTSFVTKEGATPEEVAAKYEKIRAGYTDQPDAPRPIKAAETPKAPAAPEITPEEAAKAVGKPLLTEADVESMSTGELASEKLGHEAGQIAGLSATEADVPRLRAKYAEAQQNSMRAMQLAMDSMKSGDTEQQAAAEASQLAHSGKANFYAGMLMSATKGKFEGTGSNRKAFLERVKKGPAAPTQAPPAAAPKRVASEPNVADLNNIDLVKQYSDHLAKILDHGKMGEQVPQELRKRALDLIGEINRRKIQTRPDTGKRSREPKVRVERGGESAHFSDKDGNSIKITVGRVPGPTGKGAFMPEIEVSPPAGKRLSGGRSFVGDFHQNFEQAQAQLKKMLEQNQLPGIHAMKVTKAELAHGGSWEPGELEKQPGFDPSIKASGDKLVSDLTNIGQQLSKKMSQSRRPEPFGNGPPEFGQWVSKDDVQRIPKMVKDHGDFWLVLKWEGSPRQIIKASDFAKHYDKIVSGREGAGDYLREVFVRDKPFEGTDEPGIVGMGAATPGAFPQPQGPVSSAVRSAMSRLNKLRQQAVNHFKTGNIREGLAASRDSGEVESRIYGRQVRNDFEGPMRREFGKELEQAKDALTFMRESGNDDAALRRFKDEIQNSTKADPKWAKKAIDAIDYALYNFDRLRPFSDEYQVATEEQNDQEHLAGFDTATHRNYVPHRQEIDNDFGFLTTAGGESSTGFRHMRVHETLADSIAAGVDPKSINALDLLESRVHSGQRMINTRTWVESLRGVTDPINNAALVVDPIVRTRPGGDTDVTAPRGYTIERIGNQFAAVHNGYEGIISALANPSWWSKSAARKNFLKGFATAKSINLMIDTFHLGRVAFIQSAIKLAGLSTMKAPIPSFEKGSQLLDYTSKEINNMAAAGELTPERAAWLLSKKADLELLTSEGFNVGRIADSLYQDWIHNLPIAGKVNRWIFDQFQRGAMTEVGLLELERQRGMYKDLTDRQVARQVAKDINTRFGQLGRQGIFKSRTAQDIARVLFFAPQWNEGLIRSELGAIGQAGKTFVDAVTGRRIASGALLRTAGVLVVGQFLANQIINMVTRGKPTWENPEEGIGAKLSAWIPDKIGSGSGFFLNPMSLGAEISHLIMNRYERTSDWRKTLNDFARGRLSNGMRPLYTFVSNTDRFGRGIRQGDVWKEMMMESIPTPIPASAAGHAVKQAVTGRSSEAFPGQFEKQLLASAGVRTDYAPSPDQRISSLAKDYNTKKGIEPSAEFYQSDYQPFILSLRSKNALDQASALQDLLKKKTPEQVLQHFHTWPNFPFTGQRAREKQFYETLSPEQKDEYHKAVDQRKQLATTAVALLRQTPRTRSLDLQPVQRTPARAALDLQPVE